MIADLRLARAIPALTLDHQPVAAIALVDVLSAAAGQQHGCQIAGGATLVEPVLYLLEQYRAGGGAVVVPLGHVGVAAELALLAIG